MDANKRYTTNGYPIVAIKDEYITEMCLIKIWFGKKYYPIRAKRIKDCIDNIAKQLRTSINKGGVAEDQLLHHVVNHVRRTRPLSASIEIVSVHKSPLELIKAEQDLLDATVNDVLCLSNTLQAYVPIGTHFINENDKKKFLAYYEKTRK